MKCNAEFNKLIKTVGHRARFFSKNDVEEKSQTAHTI